MEDYDAKMSLMEIKAIRPEFPVSVSPLSRVFNTPKGGYRMRVTSGHMSGTASGVTKEEAIRKAAKKIMKRLVTDWPYMVDVGRLYLAAKVLLQILRSLEGYEYTGTNQQADYNFLETRDVLHQIGTSLTLEVYLTTAGKEFKMCVSVYPPVEESSCGGTEASAKIQTLIKIIHVILPRIYSAVNRYKKPNWI